MAKETYKTATINVDTDGETITPAFDIYFWRAYSNAGAFTVELYSAGWGEAIPAYNGIAVSDNFEATRMRLKSAAGTIAITYYLRGQ